MTNQAATYTVNGGSVDQLAFSTFVDSLKIVLGIEHCDEQEEAGETGYEMEDDVGLTQKGCIR